MFIYFTISIDAIICVTYLIHDFNSNLHNFIHNDPIKFEAENTVLTHYFSTLHFHAP